LLMLSPSSVDVKRLFRRADFVASTDGLSPRNLDVGFRHF